MLSLSQIAYKDSDEKAVFECLKKLNIRFMETTPGILFPNQPAFTNPNQEMLQKVKKYGLKIESIQALLFGHPDLELFGSKQLRTKTMAHLKKLIKSSSDTGINTFVFGAPKNRNIPRGINSIDAYKIAKSFFTELALYASLHNSIICMEPIPASYGCNFINNFDEAVMFVRDINNNAFKINLDTGSLIANQEKIKNVSDVTNFVGNVHISGLNLSVINPHDKYYQYIFKLLKKSSYNRNITLEMRPVEHSNVEIIEATLEQLISLSN